MCLAETSQTQRHEGPAEIKPIQPRPQPKCEAKIKPSGPGWYRDARANARCSYNAKFTTSDGKFLCRRHAVKWWEQHNPKESSADDPR